jgi:hypothetical protein
MDRAELCDTCCQHGDPFGNITHAGLAEAEGTHRGVGRGNCYRQAHQMQIDW